MAGARQAVGEARRIVVKVGSSSLTTAAGGLDADRVDALVDVLAKVRGTDKEI
ncbi:glutamate 5-kinase, partial [Streptomyces sp. SID5914]|nr:glutamate 5-kinase [Streptomyces sp. SID5914]